MDQETRQKLEEQRELMLKIYISVEKTRKYFLWTLIGSVLLFVLPLIIFMVILPSIINNVTSGLGGL